MVEQELQFDALSPLLAALCDGALDAEGFARLEQLLAADPAARRCYIDYMDLHGELCWDHRREEGRGTRGEGRGLGTSVPSTVVSGQWSVVSKANIQHPTSNISNPQSPAPTVPFIVVDNTLPSPLSSLPSFLFSYTVAALLMGVGILIGHFCKVEHYTEFARSFGTSPATVEQPKLPAAEDMTRVARVTGLVDCRWERKGLGIGDWGLDKGSGAANPPSTIHHPKSFVRLGDKFALASGLLQLTYDSGANVILQGPCTYEVDSAAGGFLFVGKLTARVEKRGERRGERGEKQVVSGQWSVAGKSNIQHPTSNISNPQSLIPNPSLSPLPLPPSTFVVKTPTAVVTDLGTEFGVEVDKKGLTTSHVFRGLVRLQTVSADGRSEGESRVLRENESARVDETDGQRRIALISTFSTSVFVQHLPKEPERIVKTLDLVDVVAGGDGFSSRRNRGIDPTNGRTTDTPGEPAKDANDYLVGDGQYHRVTTLPFVDGVFIPDGRRGPVRVDSAGHTFDGCPNTANTTSGYIWVGGVIPGIPTQLGGVEYSSPGHGVLFLHANKGITFNLDAIRRANPGCRLLRFRAMAGDTDWSGGASLADLWVLVDGQIRFSRWQINSTHGAFSVAVPISENDHFLTLVATDGNGDIGLDWTMFGDPRLELTPAKVREDAGLSPK